MGFNGFSPGSLGRSRDDELCATPVVPHTLIFLPDPRDWESVRGRITTNPRNILWMGGIADTRMDDAIDENVGEIEVKP